MKNIGIITNANKEGSLEYMSEVAAWLKGHGINPVGSAFSGTAYDSGHDEFVCSKSDMVVVLGGDGTILHAARKAAKYGVPLLGINFGNLGYLTDAARTDGFNALLRVLEGDYKTERRMMLEAEITDADGDTHTPQLSHAEEGLLALNDICVLRNAPSRMVNVDICINGDYLDTYRADGIIVATPTGSTAYNLSAGGPILKPDTRLMAITPISPHKMYSRSYVVSSLDRVLIKIGQTDENSVVLSVDGQRFVDLKEGQAVEIRRSELYTDIIKTNRLSFYDILRHKFHNS